MKIAILIFAFSSFQLMAQQPPSAFPSHRQDGLKTPVPPSAPATNAPAADAPLGGPDPMAPADPKRHHDMNGLVQ